MPPSANNPKPKKSFGSLLRLIFILAIIAGLFLNRQNLFDWYKLRNYTAPASVAQLATDDAMTPLGRKIFYVNHPVVNDKASFLAVCPNNGGEKTIILGCYHSWQAGVYVLAVTDPLLNGVEQVTSAHEMLHAAYDRLSPSERNKVNGWLMNYYHNDLKDDRIKKIIDAYKQSEPKDVVNEMHSVFGTEIAQLPAPLEAYYKQYFTNRQQVTTYSAAYQAVFTSRQNTVKNDDARLASLKTQIEDIKAQLKDQYKQIIDRQEQLQALRNSNQTASYNAQVPAYNQEVENYNSEVRQLQSLVNQYNQLVAERNAIVFEEQQLSNELNATVPSPIEN